MARDWLYRNWMYAGAVAALFLLALVPLLVGAFGLPLLLVYLQLPIYLIHQVEEHHGDRFRQFVNDHVAGGRPALTTPAVVFINIAGVWCLNLVVLFLARFVDLGLGLIVVYLTLVNAFAHVASSALLRCYNPGLVTALVLFVPVGTWALVVLARAPGVTATQHAIGLGIAVLIHAAIVVHVKRRRRKLGSESN